MSINRGKFKYEEIIEDENNIPDFFQLNSNISSESLILRLLVGGVKLTHTKLETSFKQNNNFCKLGEINENATSKASLLEHIDYIDPSTMEDVRKYFLKNKVNDDVYTKILNEYANYFYQSNKGCHLAAFVHLYRSIEYLCYPFPLIYAFKTKTFKNSFDNLKVFFGDTNNGGGSRFFDNFISTLIDDDILELKLNLNIASDNESIILEDIEVSEIEQIINKMYKQAIDTNVQDYEYNNGTISIPYKHFWSVIITIRDSFFHYENGGQAEFEIDKLDTDLFFSIINKDILNWLSYIFLEMYKFGVENR